MSFQDVGRRELFVTAGPEPYDYQHTREIVCPYCGDEFADSWEYVPRNGTSTAVNVECYRCEGSFEVEVDVDVTYRSVPREDTR